jgi:hypothetical protein
MNWKIAIAVVAVLASSTFTLAQVLGTTMSGPNPWIDVTAYGARGDAQVSTETPAADTCSVVTTGGGKTLNCTVVNASFPFVQTDVGKSIEIPLAGGTPGSPATLLTKIVGVSPSGFVATLLDQAANNSGQVPVTWGTDNSTPVQKAMNACPTNNRGLRYLFPGR